MKILLVHTYYWQKGGEDLVFAQDQLLLGRTNEVKAVEFRNQPGWRGALQFFSSIWNIRAGAKLKKAIKEFKPDVIHLHNLHYAIGPIALRIIRKSGIPMVVTLHNYRLVCPSTTLVYKGKLFTDSLKASFPMQAISNKVYRDSAVQTFWLAFVIWVHKLLGTWKMVDRYIVLTDFARNVFVDSSFGVAADRYVVKPNFLESKATDATSRNETFLFAGRLSEEKGIHVLLEAFSKLDAQLIMIGDGPLRALVEAACKKSPNIILKGHLDNSSVRKLMYESTALIFPSIWYEGMPMTLLESFATGTPVIASNLGAMQTMIIDGYNGLHFEAGEAESLANAVRRWQSLSPAQKEMFSKNAADSYNERYTPQLNLERSLSIYKSVLH